MKLTKHNIVKISLLTFLFLFIILYYIETNYYAPRIEINRIDESYINKFVSFKAEITKQNLNKNTLFLTLKDETGKINAVIFKQNSTLNQLNYYLFEGKIIKYKKKIEIIIYSAKNLN